MRRGCWGGGRRHGSQWGCPGASWNGRSLVGKEGGVLGGVEVGWRKRGAALGLGQMLCVGFGGRGQVTVERKEVVSGWGGRVGVGYMG